MNRRFKPANAITASLFNPDLDGRLSGLFERYLAQHAAGKPFSDDSQEIYRQFWRPVQYFCRDRNLELTELTPDLLRLMLSGRKNESVTGAALTPRYAWRVLRLVEAVMNFEAREAGTPPNTAASELIHADYRFVNAKNRDALPDTLSRDETLRLIEHLTKLWPRRDPDQAPVTDWKDARNRALLAVMLGVGLAPREAAGLLFENIRLDPRGTPERLRIQVHGRNPARDVPIEDWPAQVLKAWLQVRAALLGSAGEPREAFPSTRNGKTLDNSTLNHAFHDAMEACRIPGTPRAAGEADSSNLTTRGPYTLRHTFVVKARAEARVSDERLMEILGMVDRKAFARYRRVVF